MPVFFSSKESAFMFSKGYQMGGTINVLVDVPAV